MSKEDIVNLQIRKRLSEIEDENRKLKEWVADYRDKLERLREENAETIYLVREQQQQHRTLLQQLIDTKTSLNVLAGEADDLYASGRGKMG